MWAWILSPVLAPGGQSVGRSGFERPWHAGSLRSYVVLGDAKPTTLLERLIRRCDIIETDNASYWFKKRRSDRWPRSNLDAD